MGQLSLLQDVWTSRSETRRAYFSRDNRQTFGRKALEKWDLLISWIRSREETADKSD